MKSTHVRRISVGEILHRCTGRTPKVKRSPKYTLRECADKLGVKYGQITKAMAEDPNHILPDYRAGSWPVKCYYDLDKLRTWYEAHLAKREEKSAA